MMSFVTQLIESIRKFDFSILKFINSYFRNNFFDAVMPAISSLGDKGLIWILISLLLIISKKYRKVGVLCLGALALGTLMSEGIIKHIVRRPRPFLELPDIDLLIKKPSSFSFPSGHTTSSFAAANIISVKIKKYSIPAMLLASLIAFSRLYLFVHYPFDVLAGIILGILTSKLVLYLNEKSPEAGKR